MANYKSEIVRFAYPAERVFDKFSNLEGLGELLKNIPADQVPADQLSMLEQVKVSNDCISFPAGPVGEVMLKLEKAEKPSLIELQGYGTPVPLQLEFHIIPLTPDTCESYVEIEIGIPAMLKPMVGGTMQKMANQFADMLRKVPME